MPFGKKATTKKAKKQKAKEAPSKKTQEMGPLNMSYSPNKMGHSPAEMSAELKYNTVVDIEEGKAKGDMPFTHKHFGSKSAAMMKGDSPMEKHCM
jgi:hypothetical protein